MRVLANFVIIRSVTPNFMHTCAWNLGESGCRFGLEIRENFGFKAVTGLETDDVGDGLTVLEENEGGHSHYAILLHDVGVGIDIKEADDELAGIFLGEFVQIRSDHFARGTPFGRKIDQDGEVRLEDGGGEIRGG